MSGTDKEMQARHALWEKRLERYAEYGDWGAFALATVQGSIEEINALKEEGRRLVATRDGNYRNWDPDVLAVDEAAEGYIFDCLKRFSERKSNAFSARVISEEAGERSFGTGSEKIVIISDPFDGSLLYKNDLGAFYFTTVAAYDGKGNHLATAIGDCVNRRVDFANTERAFTAKFAETALTDVRPPKLSINTDLSKVTIESYLMKPKYLYQEADDAYSFIETFKPLFSKVKFVCPNGGPGGFSDVAFGRMDVYFAHKQPLIDVFSGVGVARLAGAVITDFDGNAVPFSDDINKRFYVIASANRELHDQILTIVAGIRKATGLEWKKRPK
ncbi:MAG TPA: inositol monophosphatase family protein [Planctomycetota bacterium]|nr:inositol monophosphatase family protein [Planctomycetota bacterium]